MGKIKEVGISKERRLVFQESDKSSVSDGKHLIVDIVARDDVVLGHYDLTETEKCQAFLSLMEHLQNQHPDGRWAIMLNGPGMANRPTFHLHGTLPEAPGQTLRFVFNPSAFLVKLKKYAAGQVGLSRHPVDVAELNSLVKEFEDNLK